ncbi:diguanylate cyclase [Desulfopila sp. IMCC35006]|nr:diguanylate cyclase [Desulfopila sp. IMCC35006]TKB26595.1 diguanylate cyclase [Desulfopila sp. IMCC35006]
MLIQPGNSREGGFRSAERLRLIIEQHPLQYKTVTIGATISLGVALYHPGESLDDLISRVDSSLYHAKRQGKNQVGSLSIR